MATTTIPNGGSSSITSQTVNLGDILNITSGGTATETIINSGTVNVSTGGLADNTTVMGRTSSGSYKSSAGVFNVFNGGTATKTIINSGTVNVSSGGLADNTSVYGANANGSRGEFKVFNGGAATNTAIVGGSMFLISAGATATNTTITSGASSKPGDLRISGGTATSNTINVGGYLKVWSGTAISNTINSGGVLFLSKGLGIAEHTTINNGGHMSITNGATASDTTVSSGGTMTLASGTANSTTVLDGGTMIVFYGTFSNGLVNSGSVVVGNQGAENFVVSADTIDTKDGTFTAYGKNIILTGINQTPLQLDGKITLINSSFGMNLSAMISGGTTGAMISGGTTGGTIEAQGMVTVKDSIITANTFNVVDLDENEKSTIAYAELKFTGANTLDNVDLTLTTSISTTTNTAGMTTVEGTLTVTNSTLTTNKWVTNNGTIEMDAKSTITAVSLSNTGTGVIINGSADEFSTYANGNMKKVIDLSSGTEDAQIALGSSTTGLYLVYHEKDYWLADVDQTTMYVDGAWSEKSGGGSYSYGDAIAGETKKYFGYNAFTKAGDAQGVADATALFIEGGTYDAEDNIPTFNGIPTTIQAGTFSTSVCGGSVFAAGPASADGSITLTINGGSFNKLVFAGDRVNGGGGQTRTGNLSTTITDGTFNSAVAGAMLVTVNTAAATLEGDVELIIRGGTFTSWIYGGGLATQKTNGGANTIQGNVTVKLDATNNAVTVSNLVVGSYGAGKIGDETDKKNTKLVLTGTNDITATGEIWGGCSSDIITSSKIPQSGNRIVDSTVSGKRILSFTGFDGTLSATKIRAFSDVEVKSGSSATLSGSSINLSDVVNWTFEKGSSLTGDFVNDFYGDTLNLTEFTAGTFDLMFDSNTSANDIFNGFGALADIQMDGVSVKAGAEYTETETAKTWAWTGGSLAVSNGTKLTLTIA